MKYCIALQINIKLHAKWKEIDVQGTEDINYKKKIDQLEKIGIRQTAPDLNSLPGTKTSS